MTKANLFLIGAAKAGTTALAEMLGSHPEIASLAIKEPGHFCTDLRPAQFSDSYNQMLQWDEEAYFSKAHYEQRHMGFVESATHYNHLVAAASKGTYVLDASTAYLYSETAAQQVHTYHPNAKIIAVLRNPVSRAYSHYNMALKYGKEQRSFVDALQAESQLERAQWGQHECYLELGNYAQQLRSWRETFPAGQILILLHDELKANPESVWDRVLHFLDLDTQTKPQLGESNVGEVPTGALSSWFIRNLGAKGARMLPRSLKPLLKSWLLSPPEPIGDDAQRFLVRYFAPTIDALEADLDIDLTHWKK